MIGLLLTLARQNPADLSLRADSGRRGPLDHRHVAVVINSEDPLSEAIGRHYQRVRGIPREQVLRVRFPPHRANLDPGRFLAIRRQLLRDTPSRVQVYALAWALALLFVAGYPALLLAASAPSPHATRACCKACLSVVPLEGMGRGALGGRARKALRAASSATSSA